MPTGELWWTSDTPTSWCSTHTGVHLLLHSAGEMIHKTQGRRWCLCIKKEIRTIHTPLSSTHIRVCLVVVVEKVEANTVVFCGFVNSRTVAEILTIMMQQGAVLCPLLHVIQLNGFIFTSCDDEPLTGCNSWYGGSMGVMCEVCFWCPLLQQTDERPQNKE